MAEIAYLGGSPNGPGVSSYVLTDERYRIGVDWGIDASGDRLRGPLVRYLKESNSKLDALYLTHGHADHVGGLSGALRYLKDDAPILASPQTVFILKSLLHDGLDFHPEYFRKLGGLMPVVKALQRAKFRELHPGKNMVLPGVESWNEPVGHVPGACSVTLRTSSGTNVVFTGDMAWHDQPVVKGAKLISERLREGHLPPEWIPDILACVDLTYGGEERKDPIKEMEKLKPILRRAAECRGKVVIAAFAFGRGQNILLMLRDFIRAEKLPIHLASDGSIGKIMEHFDQTHWSDLDVSGFSTEGIEFIRSESRRLELIHSNEPVVIVTTAGMGDGGPFKTYAELLLDNPDNSFVFVSYLAPTSFGKKLVEVAPRHEMIQFTMNGLGNEEEARTVTTTVNAEVHSLNFTAHGSLTELHHWVSDIVTVRGRKLDLIALTHGTPGSKAKAADPSCPYNLAQFAERLEIPERGKVIEI